MMIHLELLSNIAKYLHSDIDLYNFRCTCKDFKEAVDMNITTAQIDLTGNPTLDDIRYPKNLVMKRFVLSSYDSKSKANLLMSHLNNWKGDIEDIYIEMPRIRLFPNLFKGMKNLKRATINLRNSDIFNILPNLPPSVNSLSININTRKMKIRQSNKLPKLPNLKELTLSSTSYPLDVNMALDYFVTSYKGLEELCIESLVSHNIKSLCYFENLKTLKLINVSTTAFNNLDMSRLTKLNDICVLFNESMIFYDECIAKLINMEIENITIINYYNYELKNIHSRCPIKKLIISNYTYSVNSFATFNVDESSVLHFYCMYINVADIHTLTNVKCIMKIDFIEIEGNISDANLSALKEIFKSENIEIGKVVFKTTYVTILNIPYWAD